MSQDKQPMIVLFEFKCERKRLTGTDLLEIMITRQAMTRYQALTGSSGQTYTGMWHNVSKIRLHIVAHSYYTFEFIGKDADGRETKYHAPDWVYCLYSVYERQRHTFDELALTFQQTRDQWGAPVLEYTY